MRCILLLFCFVSLHCASDGSVWFERFKEHDKALSSGNGHIYDVARNDYLTWGESYILNSYLIAYEITKDTYWLDKFVTHSAVVISRMEDVDGDGYLGWPISIYSQNLVSNGAFNKFGDLVSATLTASWDFSNALEASSLSNKGLWHRWQATETQIMQDDENSFIIVKADGVDWRVLEFNIENYEPDALYHFSCKVKAISGNALPMVNVRLKSRGNIQRQFIENKQSGIDNWFRASVYFKAPKNVGDEVKLRLQTKSSLKEGVVAFDDCELKIVKNTVALGWDYSELSKNKTTLVNETLIFNSPDSFVQRSLISPYTDANPYYEPDTTYVVKFKARVDNKTSVGGKVEIFDVTDNKVLNTLSFDNEDWLVSNFEFRTPKNNDHTIMVKLSSNSQLDSRIWIDDVSIQQKAEYKVDDAMLVYPLLKFSNIVLSDVDLRIKYKNEIENYLSLGKKFVLKWEPMWFENDSLGAYFSSADGSMRAYSGCALPLNQMAMPGNVLIELYKLTGDEFYLTKIKKLANVFDEYFSVMPEGGYTWNYFENLFPENVPEHCKKSKVVEDVSHGNLDVSFVLNAYESGLAFKYQDVSMLIKTFKSNMWNGSYVSPIISSRVNGSVDVVSGEYLWWWIDLAKYDPEILTIVDSLWEKPDLYRIDTSAPIDPDTGIWVAQGWRILLKAQLSYWHSYSGTVNESL